MANFTVRMIAGLKVEPSQKDRLVFDAACPRLGLRVTTSGSKVFIAQWTDPATKRKVRESLGVWGSLTIEQARNAARVKLGEVAKGMNPRAERLRQKEQAERFAKLWADKARRAITLDVPTALREQLLTFLPDSEMLPKRLARSQRRQAHFGTDREDGDSTAGSRSQLPSPPSRNFVGFDVAPGDAKSAADDFDALEKLRRLAFSDKVDEPQQLSLFAEEAA